MISRLHLSGADDERAVYRQVINRALPLSVSVEHDRERDFIARVIASFRSILIHGLELQGTDRSRLRAGALRRAGLVSWPSRKDITHPGYLAPFSFRYFSGVFPPFCRCFHSFVQGFTGFVFSSLSPRLRSSRT